MSDIKSINTKHKPSCDKEEEKIIVNVNCGHENHCENGSSHHHHHHDHSDILNAISSSTTAINSAISISTITITDAINAIPACDLTGLATSTDVNDAVAGLSTHLDTSVAGLSSDISGVKTDIAGLSTHLDTSVAGLSTHLDTTLSTTESNILGALSTCCDNTQAGISNVTSIVENLYVNPCLIKSLARITSAMTPLYINCTEMGCLNGTDCGIFRDPVTSTQFKFLNDCNEESGLDEIFMESAQQSMFEFITDPMNWTGLSC